jgi:hypothetical protein
LNGTTRFPAERISLEKRQGNDAYIPLSFIPLSRFSAVFATFCPIAVVSQPIIPANNAQAAEFGIHAESPFPIPNQPIGDWTVSLLRHQPANPLENR